MKYVPLARQLWSSLIAYEAYICRKLNSALPSQFKMPQFYIRKLTRQQGTGGDNSGDRLDLNSTHIIQVTK
jgi:hypothetical protein